MLTYKQYLQEGIVKVDKNTLKIIVSLYNRLFVKYIHEYQDEKDISFSSDVNRQVDKLYDEAESFLENNKKDWEYSHDLKYSVNLKSDYEINEWIMVDFDYRKLPSKSGGAFAPHSLSLIINTRDDNFVSLVNTFISNGADARLLRVAIDDKAADIEHELVHYLENRIRKNKSAKSLYAKKNYSSDMSNYFSSPVEFEAQITTVVSRFKKLINMALVNNPNLSKEQVNETLP